jgi:hypothetical protein
MVMNLVRTVNTRNFTFYYNVLWTNDKNFYSQSMYWQDNRSSITVNTTMLLTVHYFARSLPYFDASNFAGIPQQASVVCSCFPLVFPC